MGNSCALPTIHGIAHIQSCASRADQIINLKNPRNQQCPFQLWAEDLCCQHRNVFGFILNFANPLAVVPHGFERGEISGVENVFRGGENFALFQIVVGIARADGHELQHARIAVTIDHALRATVADDLRLVEIVDVAHGRFPRVTAVEIQIPIEIKIFVPAEAAEFFRLFFQMALHFAE